MSNIAVRTWDKMPGWGQFIIVGGTLFFGGRAVKKGYDRYSENQNLKKQKKVFEQSQVSIPIKDDKGNITTVTFNTAVAAAKIHDAIYNNDWLGWTEDEGSIVAQLKQTPKPYIGEVIENYKKLYNKNLQEDVIKALSTDQWNQVDYLFA